MYMYIYILCMYVYMHIYLYVYTTMALWQLVHLDTCCQVHELSQNHCGDNREGTLF